MVLGSRRNFVFDAGDCCAFAHLPKNHSAGKTDRFQPLLDRQGNLFEKLSLRLDFVLYLFSSGYCHVAGMEKFPAGNSFTGHSLSFPFASFLSLRDSPSDRLRKGPPCRPPAKDGCRKRILVLTKRIIPCLDVEKGRVVKGVKFISLRDAGDPVACAQAYDQVKADELVFLDITASHENRPIMLEVVSKVAESVYIPFTVGGGIRTVEDIRNLLKAGSDKVSINTAAVEDLTLVREASKRFGAQCIVVAIDAKQTSAVEWRVFTHGGRRQTDWNVIDWAKKVEQEGAGEILLTSMDRDGTKNGYDIELTQRVSEAVRIPVIASGGAGSLDHLYDAFTRGKADAVLAASIFHFGEYTIHQAKSFLSQKGLPIRL